MVSSSFRMMGDMPYTSVNNIFKISSDADIPSLHSDFQFYAPVSLFYALFWFFILQFSSTYSFKFNNNVMINI